MRRCMSCGDVDKVVDRVCMNCGGIHPAAFGASEEATEAALHERPDLIRDYGKEVEPLWP